MKIFEEPCFGREETPVELQEIDFWKPTTWLLYNIVKLYIPALEMLVDAKSASSLPLKMFQ